MSTSLSYAFAGLLAVASLTIAPPSSADDAVPLQKGPYTTVSIVSVRWMVAPGGVGTFVATVSNTATAKTAVTGWVSATSAGAPTLRTNLGTLVPGQNQSLNVSATAHGRCYTIAIALDPDAGANGIRWDGVSRTACLDPDGGGIIAGK